MARCLAQRFACTSGLRPTSNRCAALPFSSFKGAYTHIRTPLQQFSEDEDEADQPLAPIQPEDLVEVVEGDDDMEQDEAANSNATPGPMSRDVSEPAPLRPQNESVGDISAPPSKAPSPKPHPLSISFQPPTPTPGPEDVDDGLQDALMPPQAGGEDEGELGGIPLDGGDLSMGGDEGMSLIPCASARKPLNASCPLCPPCH